MALEDGQYKIENVLHAGALIANTGYDYPTVGDDLTRDKVWDVTKSADDGSYEIAGSLTGLRIAYPLDGDDFNLGLRRLPRPWTLTPVEGSADNRYYISAPIGWVMELKERKGPIALVWTNHSPAQQWKFERVD